MPGKTPRSAVSGPAQFSDEHRRGLRLLPTRDRGSCTHPRNLDQGRCRDAALYASECILCLQESHNEHSCVHGLVPGQETLALTPLNRLEADPQGICVREMATPSAYLTYHLPRCPQLHMHICGH